MHSENPCSSRTSRHVGRECPLDIRERPLLADNAPRILVTPSIHRICPVKFAETPSFSSDNTLSSQDAPLLSKNATLLYPGTLSCYPGADICRARPLVIRTRPLSSRNTALSSENAPLLSDGCCTLADNLACAPRTARGDLQLFVFTHNAPLSWPMRPPCHQGGRPCHPRTPLHHSGKLLDS